MARKTTRGQRGKAKARPRRSKRPAAPKTRGSATASTGSGSGSPYRYHDDEIERLLRSRGHAPLLEEYFGEANYRELRDLAQEASTARVRGGARVLILPGIMGSKLGVRGRFLDDTIWIDPIDIARGKLFDLALPDGKITALGVVLLAYLKLKLRLKVAGYNADFYPFDWRQSIDKLGRDLLDAIQLEPAGQVHLVAHSMGGLVARAALALPNNKKVARLIMLGTPNYGSFSPVQALTATHPMVQKVVAALDLKHSAAELAEGVFKTLPGLYQMLPSPERFNRVDLYSATTWPAATPRPDPSILRGVHAVQEGLAEADDRFFLIAGVNQDTITGLHIEEGDFVYETTSDGDGTVPLAFCQLPGAKTYYVEESHGSLPNNRTVEESVIDLLASGDTSRLPTSFTPTRSRGLRSVRAADIRARQPFEGRRGKDVSRAELRHLLDEFVSPDSRDGLAPSAASAAEREETGAPSDDCRLDQVVVARRRQRVLEIRLAHGSITDLRTRAYVLGLFKEVDPAGAAGAVDAYLDGALKEFTSRRMFSGQVGEVFAMPAGRYRLGAETVLFTGLGTFDSFNSEVLQFVAENVVRTFVRTHVEDFATVLLGAGSGTSASKSVYNHLVGFFRGLRDADRDQELRRITFCEIDPVRFREMKDEIYRLARTNLFDEVQVTLSEVELPAPAPPPRSQRARLSVDSDVAYLIVRQEPSVDHTVVYRSSILTAGTNAAVLSGARDIPRKDLTDQLQRIEKQGFNAATLADYGQKLADMVLDGDVAEGLKRMADKHLVVVHDAATSQIPWETLSIDGWTPATNKGMSRRYAADNLSVAKWLDERRYGRQLDLLLVVNPTQDLDGAEEEAKRIEKIFPSSSRIRLHRLHGAEATRAALLSAFRSGNYDVIHYAGHAYFDEAEPSLSGIVCHDARLTGADLAGLSKLPALVFFNACESGRIRGNPLQAHRRRGEIPQRIAKNVGLAEAFLRGGVSSYIGTYWPVGDAEASAFAQTFYEKIVDGTSVGDAVNAGRQAVLALPAKSVDWADYVHYGASDFAIKGLS